MGDAYWNFFSQAFKEHLKNKRSPRLFTCSWGDDIGRAPGILWVEQGGVSGGQMLVLRCAPGICARTQYSASCKAQSKQFGHQPPELARPELEWQAVKCVFSSLIVSTLKKKALPCTRSASFRHGRWLHVVCLCMCARVWRIKKVRWV